MYENYIFDLYGTLVDIHTDESKKKLWEKMSVFYGYHGAVYTPQELKKAYRARAKEMQKKLYMEQQETVITWKVKKKRDEEGNIRLSKKVESKIYPEIELLDVFLKLFQQKGVDVGLKEAHEAARTFRLLSTDYLRLYPGTKEMLTALKKKGAKLYLLSNAQACFTMPELKYLGIDEYFDAIYISSDHGFKKPDRRFFQKLITEQQLDVSQSIMTGNEYKCDIKRAGKEGLSTLYIRSNLTPEGEEGGACTYELDGMDMEAVTQILLG